MDSEMLLFIVFKSTIIKPSAKGFLKKCFNSKYGVSTNDMLKESYISMWKKLPVDSIKVRVARPSVLSASKKLMTDYKSARITWETFEARFRDEIKNNPNAVAELQRLKILSKTKDVYLICYEKNYPCHRFILMNMINELP